MTEPISLVRPDTGAGTPRQGIAQPPAAGGEKAPDPNLRHFVSKPVDEPVICQVADRSNTLATCYGEGGIQLADHHEVREPIQEPNRYVVEVYNEEMAAMRS